ncbi:MAG: hypothetical protein A3F91_11635 [Flavobacteria bacterium RIFCSPLOWO2_12_FULL_35_11]|nr:MAG: hypothetical protein A3F91_11635 [Flavobacteria bacterium RIFCSPLOWO2_12_FULL_35_11]
MDEKTKKGTQISRRGILPLLGSTLLLPLLGFGKTSTIDEIIVSDENEEYQTLLKPDGTAVRVKVSTVKNSKIIQKNISNESFLNWLGRKL